MLKTLAVSLGLTLVVEVPLAAVLGLRRRDLLLAALVNVLTNPAVVLLHMLFPAAWVKFLLEGAAVTAEGFYYSRYGNDIRRPWLLSLLLNAASFGIGCAVSALY